MLKPIVHRGWRMKDEGWRMKDEGWRMKDECRRKNKEEGRRKRSGTFTLHITLHITHNSTRVQSGRRHEGMNASLSLSLWSTLLSLHSRLCLPPNASMYRPFFQYQAPPPPKRRRTNTIAVITPDACIPPSRSRPEGGIDTSRKYLKEEREGNRFTICVNMCSVLRIWDWNRWKHEIYVTSINLLNIMIFNVHLVGSKGREEGVGSVLLFARFVL